MKKIARLNMIELDSTQHPTVAGCISGLSTAQLAIACDESPNAVPLAISLDSEF